MWWMSEANGPRTDHGLRDQTLAAATAAQADVDTASVKVTLR